jgi:hypothetical protein
MQNVNKLSRAEMKNVKGGTNGPACKNSTNPCSFTYTDRQGLTSQVDGHCGVTVGLLCYCADSMGRSGFDGEECSSGA